MMGTLKHAINAYKNAMTKSVMCNVSITSDSSNWQKHKQELSAGSLSDLDAK